MKRQTWKKIGRYTGWALCLYLAGGAALYFFQGSLLFHPKPLSRQHVFSFDQPFTEQNIPAPPNRNLNMVRFTVPGGKRKGIVLYFHGNMRNLERYAKYARYFTRSGYEVWMPDYPGFGKSTGKRTEAVMHADAELVYRIARAEVSPSDLLILGRSIGTGPATRLAARNPCRQLILETPYYSIDALARHYFPIYPLLPRAAFTFPNFAHLPKVQAPVLIFHGTKDEVVPYEQALRLKKENPGVELVTIKGGKHNNLYDYPEVARKLEAFLLQGEKRVL